jgi:hypothetical protein
MRTSAAQLRVIVSAAPHGGCRATPIGRDADVRRETNVVAWAAERAVDATTYKPNNPHCQIRRCASGQETTADANV